MDFEIAESVECVLTEHLCPSLIMKVVSKGGAVARILRRVCLLPRERRGVREGGRESGREGIREGGREGGREGRRAGGKEGGKEEGRDEDSEISSRESSSNDSAHTHTHTHTHTHNDDAITTRLFPLFVSMSVTKLSK